MYTMCACTQAWLTHVQHQKERQREAESKHVTWASDGKPDALSYQPDSRDTTRSENIIQLVSRQEFHEIDTTPADVAAAAVAAAAAAATIENRPGLWCISVFFFFQKI